ncbi:MAG: hypothetical protein C5B47_04335 [Verrucomicrobia bacterium]|nr:MAG: hypothetical protein C5B47_04335 [Verrucomicrobiota bacterium]
MAENDFDSREVWDEYDWERFLQEQDRSTEKYFDLLEQYMDHPERDEIISREMGWEHHNDEDSDLEISVEFQTVEDCLEHEDADAISYPPIYLETVRLHNMISSWMDNHPDVKEHPEVIRLAACSAICGAKLAAALSGENNAEIGMTIAYLKRGLKAANDSLSATARLFELKLLAPRQKSTLNRQLFWVRDRVVELIGNYRAEWRRRYGTS